MRKLDRIPTRDPLFQRGESVTENLTLSLNLNLRAPNHTVRSRAAEQVHSRARQVVYDVTTKGARLNENKKAVFDIDIDHLRSLARLRRGAAQSHVDRCREGRRAIEDSSLRFRQEVLKEQQHLYRIDRHYGSTEEERFQLKVRHGPLARSVSQKLLRQERDEVGTHRRAKKQGQRGGKSAGSKKTTWVRKHPGYEDLDQLMITRSPPSLVYGHPHSKTMGKLSAVRSFLETHSAYSDRRWLQPMPLPIAGYRVYSPLTEKQGLLVPYHNSRDNTTAHIAAASGKAAVLDKLLQSSSTKLDSGGLIVNAVNSDGATPLHLAADGGSLLSVNLLLQHGADVSLTTNAGDTALSIAVQRKQWIIARALVEHAGKGYIGEEAREGEVDIVGQKNSQGVRPIHYAAWHGNRDIVELFIDNSADINVEDPFGNTAMTIAAYREHLPVCVLLLSRGAAKDSTNSQGLTPLHVAAGNGHIDCVRALVDAGVDINGIPEKDRACSTSVASAARLPPLEKQVRTPAKLALLHGHLKTFEYLIARGAADVEEAVEDVIPRPLPPIKAKVSAPGSRPATTSGRQRWRGGAQQSHLCEDELHKFPWSDPMRKEEIIHSIQNMKVWPASVGMDTGSLWVVEKGDQQRKSNRPRKGRPVTAA